MKKLLFLMLAILFAMQSWSQETVTIGNGTTGVYNRPINTFYNYSVTQQIYTASDITTANGGALPTGMAITQIGFPYFYGTSSAYNNIDIYLCNTTKTEFTGTTASNWEPYANLTQVYSGSITFDGTTGWTMVTLQTAFIWDGVSNIILCVNDRKAAYLTSSNNTFYTHSTTNYTSLYTQRDGSVYNIASEFPSGSRAQTRNNIRFVFEAHPACLPPITPSSSDILPFTATVSWAHHPLSTATEWEVQYKPATESDWANATTVESLSDTVAYLSNLTSATTYNWRVREICGEGSDEGIDFSIWTTGSFTTAISCPAPTGVHALSETITTEEVLVVWNPESLALEYEIQYKANSIASWTAPEVVSETVSDTAYLMQGLTANTLYNFRVRTTCDLGNDYSTYVTYNVRTACDVAITSLPWSDSFDDYGTGSPIFPPCWTKNTSYTGYPYVSATNHSAPGSLYFYASSSSGNYNIAATPKFDEAIAINSLRVKGWYYYTNANAAMQVGVMTDPVDASTFVSIATIQSTGSWIQFEVLLNSYQGSGHYIAFKTDGAIAYGSGYLDDIVIEPIPECPDVYDFAVNQGSNYSAKIFWNNTVTDAAQSGWTLAWDEAPAASFDPEAAANIVPLTAANYPYFVQGLTAGSTYSFAMRSACADGAWSATKTITILGIDAVTVPYYEDFEITDTLSFYSSSANKWAIGSATGNPGNSMYISNDSGATNNYTNNTTTYAIASIPVDFGNFQEYLLQFDWKAQGESALYDYMRVYLAPLSYTPSGAWPSGAGVQQIGGNFNLKNSWQHAEITISSTHSGTVQKLLFVWWNDISGGSQPPAAVDNIAIDGITCASPTNIQLSAITQTSVNVTWTATGSATDWILYYKPVDAVTADSVLVSGTPAQTLINLLHSTNYQVWLKSDCGVDGLSYNSSVSTFRTLCGAITSLPWSENFDTYGTGNYANFPTCFSRQNTYSPTGNPYITATNHSAPGSLYNYASSEGTYSLSVTPEFGASLPLNTLRLKFWHYAPYTASPLKIGVMSNPADVSTFVELQTYTVLATNTWEERELLLNNAPDSCHYIAFMTVYASGGYGYGYIDDIVVDPIPPCPNVYNFAVYRDAENTAIVSWDNTVVDDMESGWTIVYDEVDAGNFDPTTAANSFPVTVDDMPYAIPNVLTVGSTYTFAMRAACGGTWTTPWEYTVPVVVTLPYSQDFEDLDDVAEWNFYSDATNAWAINTATGNQGNSMYISNNSGASNEYSNNTTHAIASVYVDFGDYSGYNLSFDWRCQGESASWDRMQVWVVPASLTLPSTWGNTGNWITGTGACLVGNYYGQSSWTANPVSVDIPGSFSGTTGKILFMWYNDGSGGSNPPAAVDNISLTALTCGAPYNITIDNITQTSADITWGQAGAATNWLLYWRAAGSAVVDSVSVSGTPAHTLINLSASTPYSVWLKTDCGGGDISNSSTIHSFNTLCGAISTLPYIQNFDNCPTGASVSAFPYCWTRLHNYSSNYYPYVSTSTAFSGTQSLYWVQPSTNNIHIAAVAPVIDPALDVSTLRVKFKMRYSSVNAIGLQVGVLTNPADYSTFVPVGAPQYLTSANVWEDKEVHLTSYVPANPGDPAYIALATFNNSSQSSNFYIDDFVIDSIPSCVDVYNFAVNTTSATSVNVSWLTTGLGDNGGAGWTIVYEPTTPALFDPTTASGSEQVTATDMPYTISNLLPGQTYTFAMRGNCGEAWSQYIQIVTPQGLPYSTDFSNAASNQNWITVANNAYVWSTGTATGNPDESAYISNDNGATHAVGSYPTYSYFYKDFDFGATPGAFDVNFDWLCEGYISDGSWYSGIMVHIRNIEDAQLPANLSSLPTWINDNSQYRISLYGSGNTWQNVSGQLQNMSGMKRVVFFYFRTISSNVTEPGAAIDNISISPNTCIVPTQVSLSDLTAHSVNVHWNNTGAANYLFTWWEDGSSPNTVMLNDTVYSLTGLTPSADYLFNIRAICGTDTTPNSITWIFTTHCEPTSLPYTENFDSYTGTTYTTAGVVPDCWKSSTTNTTYPAPHITGSGSYNYPHSGTNALTFTASSAGSDAYAVLPLFNQPIANLSISFWYRHEYAPNGTLSVGFITGEQSDMSSFTSVANAPAIDILSQFTYDFSTATVDLSNATYIVLRWYHNAVYYSCGVDDIEVTSVATCAAPTALNHTTLTDNAATITWTPGDAETEWQVAWKEASENTWNYEGATATTHNLSGLTAATDYEVKVRAICGVGDTSVWTAIHNFTTEAAPSCATPTAVVVDAVTATTATVSWTPGGNETEWMVIWAADTTDIDNFNHEVTTAIPYVITDLIAGIDYWIAVRAICGAADTSYRSIVANFTTLPCNEPDDVQITDSTANTITLTWQPVNGENKWNIIWRSNTASSGSAIVDGTPTYTLIELVASTAYEICVIAICGEGSESPEYCIPASTTSAIHDINLATTLQLYPNPTTGELRITNYKLREGDKIEVYNILGQPQSFSILDSQFSIIDVSHLSAGIYTVKIGGYIGKFVKR